MNSAYFLYSHNQLFVLLLPYSFLSFSSLGRFDPPDQQGEPFDGPPRAPLGDRGLPYGIGFIVFSNGNKRLGPRPSLWALPSLGNLASCSLSLQNAIAFCIWAIFSPS
jgi:hypothetical protein